MNAHGIPASNQSDSHTPYLHSFYHNSNKTFNVPKRVTNTHGIPASNQIHIDNWNQLNRFTLENNKATKLKQREDLSRTKFISLKDIAMQKSCK